MLCKYQKLFFNKLHEINDQKNIEIIKVLFAHEMINKYGLKRFFISKKIKESLLQNIKVTYTTNMSLIDIPI